MSCLLLQKYSNLVLFLLNMWSPYSNILLHCTHAGSNRGQRAGRRISGMPDARSAALARSCVLAGWPHVGRVMGQAGFWIQEV
jgi:hypothetical protein